MHQAEGKLTAESPGYHYDGELHKHNPVKQGRCVMTDEAIRVLVVDDEPTIVEFLKMGLTYEGYQIKTAADGRAAVQMAQEWRPQLVILDIMLPKLDGLAVCQRLRESHDLAIIMLTAKDEVEDKVHGLRQGADDYLTKPFSFVELLARIQAVLRRYGVSAQKAVLTIGPLTLMRTSREVRCGEQPVNLTPKEFDLLEMFMDHPRQVFNRETILNRVWGYDFAGDTNVVDVTVSHLREKLGDKPPRLLQTVHGIGYILREG